MAKFILLENFTWLINRLQNFQDPNITYSTVGLPNIKGGKRRIYRKDNHFSLHYTITDIGKINITFGNTNVECNKWKVNHDKFADVTMKERFPVPPGDGHTVLTTSIDSILNHTAQRYYVSCTCRDFDTTFLQKLVDYGYTADPGSIPPATGVKAIDPTICKHIFAVLVDKYSDAITMEHGIDVQPADQMPWSNILPLPIPPTIAPKAPIRDKKTEYGKLIAATLKRLSVLASKSILAYKSPTDAAKHYRKYNFMLRKYPKGYVIVYTNPDPAVNSTIKNSEFKEMVPIYTRTAHGLVPSPLSPVAVYSYFTKEELQDLIRANATPIQPAQITRLKSVLGIKPTTPESSWLTESLDFDTSILNTIIGTI